MVLLVVHCKIASPLGNVISCFRFRTFIFNYFQMEINFDKSITKYCGSDWATQLQTITGNLSHIDFPTYHKNIEKISTCENNIRKLFKRLLKNEDVEHTRDLLDIIKRFANESSKLDLQNKTFYKKRKHSKNGSKKHPVFVEVEDISTGYYPADILKSEWFKVVKEIESEIFHVVEKVFISQEDTHIDKTSQTRRNIYDDFTFEKYLEVITENPVYVEVYKCFGVKINVAEVFDTFMTLQKQASIIINVLLRPVYDIDAKIKKAFDTSLAKVFKPEMMRKNGLTKDLVINLLIQFMLAKYRADITGNNKYFLQMLVENVTEGELAGISGPRFIEIMDTINTDALDKSSKATRFTLKAKDLIKKMVAKGDVFDESILKEVEDIMVDKDETKEETKLPEEVAKIYESLDEMFKETP